MEMSKTSPHVEWRQLDWGTIEHTVFKLQKRIYKASQAGIISEVHKLQKLLMKSWYARCLAVRKVTQDNRGKGTAGVDGIKSLTPEQRLSLAATLTIEGKAHAIRRVYIPKKGTSEKRPLGIPTMEDRAQQALTKLALEPEWEAKFEPNSYGFRPGRSAHDAREAIFIAIVQQPKYVLDADIAKCFDRINHTYLLDKLSTFPLMRKQVKAWLKAGIMDGKALFQSQEGTPQGGVISPLLANVALHGLENALRAAFPRVRQRQWDKHQRKYVWVELQAPAHIIRYADDFVILHKDAHTLLRCKRFVSEWLEPVGLELKPSKTRLTHTLHEYEGNVGFDFLGFNVRQYPVSKRQRKEGFKTLIRPSQMSMHTHVRAMREIIRKHTSKPQNALIDHLNPVIRGWSNYFSASVSSDTFSKMDFILWHQLWAWAKRSNSHARRKCISRKYWKKEGNRLWVFKTTTARLYQHTYTKIVRVAKVNGNKSPYDGDWIYWATRMGKHPECTTSMGKLLRIQKGKCNWCRLHFRDGDIMETDHIIPKAQGGKDEYQNLQLLHGHCHDLKSRTDKSSVCTAD